jgi:NADH-quinone oxidoreductase subunit C
VSHSAPVIAPQRGLNAALKKTLGKAMTACADAYGETTVTVKRDALPGVMIALRDTMDYQQLMEIAGVDYPDRAERFEVVYHLLSVTRNHRLRVKLSASEDTPVPSLTSIWPVAGWLEREVFDMYGVLFAGHPDLRRILTDYGFEGHPFRKDFPLTGYVELRYSEEQKRVVYEPVQLAQDFRNFDFMSPWEGADYILPGDEKASPPAAAPTPKTTDKPSQTGAGKQANKAAAKKTSLRDTKAARGVKEPGAPDPTISHPQEGKK